MDDLIIRALQGRTAPEEEERLLRWRRESPQNEHYYKRLEELWTLTGDTSIGSTAGPAPDPESIINRAALADVPVAGGVERCEADQRAPSAPSTSGAGTDAPFPRDRWRRRGRAAKGLLAAALALVSFGLGFLAERGIVQEPETVETELVTGAGEMATLTLPDGTGVRVAPHSTLRFSEAGPDLEEVEVWLEGRAFVGVDPDHSGALTVQTPHGEATALGTRFEVRSEADDFEVLVLDGAVELMAGGESVTLDEGELGRSDLGAPPRVSVAEDVQARLDWMGEGLVFRQTRLERAVEEIEHRYGVEVVLEDPDLGDRTVTATFTDQSLEEVAVVICEIVALACEKEDDVLTMRRPDSSQ